MRDTHVVFNHEVGELGPIDQDSDPDDEWVAASAIAGGADVLVTAIQGLKGESGAAWTVAVRVAPHGPPQLARLLLQRRARMKRARGKE